MQKELNKTCNVDRILFVALFLIAMAVYTPGTLSREVLAVEFGAVVALASVCLWRLIRSRDATGRIV